MMAAEKKYKVAAQMGNQGHSEANYFQFKAWTEAGIIKNVTKITAFMNNPRRWHGKTFTDFLPDEPIPETLDWDTWMATAASITITTRVIINGDWRSWYDFGNGALGDWGAHIFDTAHEFLKLGLPTEVDAVMLEGHSPLHLPAGLHAGLPFPARGDMPPVELTWYDGTKNLPPLPDDFGDAVVDPNIPPPSTGKVDTKAQASGQGDLWRGPHVQRRLARHHAPDHRRRKGEGYGDQTAGGAQEPVQPLHELPARLPRARKPAARPSPWRVRSARPWRSASSPSG